MDSILHMSLFSPVRFAGLDLPHRVAMAPMTRNRAAQPGDVPTAAMAEYYRQRASAAFIVTEAAQVSRQGQGYSRTPGIYTDGQVAGWRQVTGRIFLQLWHVGRMSHHSFHADGLPVAPSAIAADSFVWVAVDGAAGQMLKCSTPRALDRVEVPAVVDQFRHGAARAMAAGFDGVEIHGANGYLIDQFLRTTSNHRRDEYGGSVRGRVRFPLEVIDAVVAEVGPDRVGLRISPHVTARDMDCPEILDTVLHLAREAGARRVGYLHLAEADWDDAPWIPDIFRWQLRAAFTGSIVAARKYDMAKVNRTLDLGMIDAVAFGRPFVANPDMPIRLARGAPLADLDPATLFGGGDDGYTTYPATDLSSPWTVVG